MKDAFNKIFCSLSGAKMSILAQCPTEIVKYAGMGLTILFTAIMAAISGGYAFFIAFGGSDTSLLIPIIFGIIWGALVLNLDRFLVSSIEKTGIFISEFKWAIPRITLAIIFGIVISKPLELAIFENEINEELKILSQNVQKQQENAVLDRYFDRIKTLEEQNKDFQTQITELRKKYLLLDSIAISELEGGGPSGKPGAGPIYKQKREAADLAENEYLDAKERYDPIIKNNLAEINKVRKTKNEEIEILNPDRKSYDGLLARLEALGRLTDKNRTIWLTNIFVILLILTIEMLPIVVKLLTKRGAYDEILSLENDRFLEKAKVKKERSFQEVENWRQSTKSYSEFSDDYNQKFSDNVFKLHTDERIKKEVSKNIKDSDNEMLEQVNEESPASKSLDSIPIELEEKKLHSEDLPFWQKKYLHNIEKSKSRDK